MKKMVVVLLMIILAAAAVPVKRVEKRELISETIRIEVKGAVAEEGIIECASYSTIGDVLEKVQLQDDADLSSLNRQSVVKNKDVLVIPHKSENELISINSADLDKLCTLDGIGPATAKRIIEYRNEVGSFQKLEDLMNVKGIGEKKFLKIKEKICL